MALWRPRGPTEIVEWNPSVIWHSGRRGAQHRSPGGGLSQEHCAARLFIDIRPSVRAAKQSQTFAVRNYARIRQFRGVLGCGNPADKEGQAGWSATDLSGEEYCWRGNWRNLESEVICLFFFFRNVTYVQGFRKGKIFLARGKLGVDLTSKITSKSSEHGVSCGFVSEIFSLQVLI